MAKKNDTDMSQLTPPYVQFNYVDEWLEELDKHKTGGERLPVRVCWLLVGGADLPTIVHRYLCASFVGDHGELVELVEYLGQRIAVESGQQLTHLETKRMADLKEELKKRALTWSKGRYRLAQSPITG